MMRTVIGFLSRPHGFNVLESLLESKDYKLLRVYTHALNPKSQDPSRSKRLDFDFFIKKCKQSNVDLITIDSKDEQITNFPHCDYIVEVSWRYLIPESIAKKAKIAAFGIHRGKLPDYAGSEPIKQALEKGESEIILSSHYLEPVIDGGSVICTKSHQVNYDSNYTLEENIQRLRNEITPLFSELVFKTFTILEQNKK